MSSTTQPGSLFQTELLKQWRAAVEARRNAIRVGDSWLADLTTARLDELMEVVRLHAPTLSTL